MIHILDYFRKPGNTRRDIPCHGSTKTSFPRDAWIALVDPATDSKNDPALSQNSLGIYAERSDLAAVIAVSAFPGQCSQEHIVIVCRPGPAPKTLHFYHARRVPDLFRVSHINQKKGEE